MWRTVLHSVLAIITRGTTGGTSGPWICQSCWRVRSTLLRSAFAFAFRRRRSASTLRFRAGGSGFVVSVFLVLLRFSGFNNDAVMPDNIF